MATSNTSDDQYVLIGNIPDYNAALRNWLNLRDLTAHNDIAFSHQTFLNARTANDSTRAWLEMIAGAAGKETT